MSQHVTGAVIKALREKCHYTQGRACDPLIVRPVLAGVCEII